MTTHRKYAPERLADPEIYRGMEMMQREGELDNGGGVYTGDPTACEQAAELINALAGNEEAQHKVAEFLDPIYDKDEAGMASTAEGQRLAALIDDVLQR